MAERQDLEALRADLDLRRMWHTAAALVRPVPKKQACHQCNDAGCTSCDDQRAERMEKNINQRKSQHSNSKHLKMTLASIGVRHGVTEGSGSVGGPPLRWPTDRIRGHPPAGRRFIDYGRPG
jgi:hypothetical protein